MQDRQLAVQELDNGALAPCVRVQDGACAHQQQVLGHAQAHHRLEDFKRMQGLALEEVPHPHVAGLVRRRSDGRLELHDMGNSRRVSPQRADAGAVLHAPELERAVAASGQDAPGGVGGLARQKLAQNWTIVPALLPVRDGISLHRNTLIAKTKK